MQQTAVPTPKPQPKPTARKYVKLSDRYVSAVADFAEGETRVVWDAKVSGLRVTVGRRKIVFSFLQQHQRHGKRSTTFVTLGSVGEGMTVADARKAALTVAGRVAAGRITPGKRTATKLADSFTDYCGHLERKAKSKGKAPEWLRRARSLYDGLIGPDFAKWPLADLSNAPAIVRDWHLRMSRKHGPVSANRAAQVLRATYRYAAKLNRDLPPALPTSAVIWNAEEPAEKGLDDFAAWVAAWRSIPIEPKNIRMGFAVASLLLGTRPGELARVTWRDLDLQRRVLILRNMKSSKDLELPLSWPVLRSIKMARGLKAKDGRFHDGGKPDDPIFPGARLNPLRDKLPAYGHALRHAYRSVAKSIGIDDVLVRLLMGHSLGGSISEGYLSREMLRLPLRAAQRRISCELVRRLGVGVWPI